MAFAPPGPTPASLMHQPEWLVARSDSECYDNFFLTRPHTAIARLSRLTACGLMAIGLHKGNCKGVTDI